MKFGVIVFPGSNCDHDAYHAAKDVLGQEEQLTEWVQRVPLAVVTAGAAGALLYVNGDRFEVKPRPTVEVDATGAGDVFAASFFVRLHKTRDPWEAARFATLIASRSVTRPGLDGIPTAQEVEESMMEVLH